MSYVINTTNPASDFSDHLVNVIFGVRVHDADLVTDHVMPIVREKLAKIDYSRDALAVTDSEEYIDSIDYQIDRDLTDLIWEIERLDAGEIAQNRTADNVAFWNENRAECAEYEFEAMSNHADIAGAINEVVSMALHARAASDLYDVLEAVRDLSFKIQVI